MMAGVIASGSDIQVRSRFHQNADRVESALASSIQQRRQSAFGPLGDEIAIRRPPDLFHVGLRVYIRPGVDQDLGGR